MLCTTHAIHPPITKSPLADHPHSSFPKTHTPTHHHTHTSNTPATLFLTFGAGVRVYLLQAVLQAVHTHVHARAEDVLVQGGKEACALGPVYVQGGAEGAVAIVR